MKKRVIRWVVLLAIGFGLGMAIKHYRSQSDTQMDSAKEITSLSPDDVKEISD